MLLLCSLLLDNNNYTFNVYYTTYPSWYSSSSKNTFGYYNTPFYPFGLESDFLYTNIGPNYCGITGYTGSISGTSYTTDPNFVNSRWASTQIFVYLCDSVGNNVEYATHITFNIYRNGVQIFNQDTEIGNNCP